MTGNAGGAQPPLNIEVLPAAHAYDFEHVRARLADPSVLERSVAIRVFRAPLLAVAVGGPRRGGYFPAEEMVIGMAVLRLLAGRPGYPNLRLRWSPSPDACHVVEWGEPPPHWGDDAQCGQFYGYAEAAIQAYSASVTTRALVIPRMFRCPPTHANSSESWLVGRSEAARAYSLSRPQNPRRSLPDLIPPMLEPSW
ncbi:DUF6302 family protein [Streptomyces xanthophaeus]|uniref:DUF6302 family protein n=1 Tax=Streptomyces xanthophaeus TaxID=67385 RepID=UPI00368E6985